MTYQPPWDSLLTLGIIEAKRRSSAWYSHAEELAAQHQIIDIGWFIRWSIRVAELTCNGAAWQLRARPFIMTTYLYASGVDSWEDWTPSRGTFIDRALMQTAVILVYWDPFRRYFIPFLGLHLLNRNEGDRSRGIWTSGESCAQTAPWPKRSWRPRLISAIRDLIVLYEPLGGIGANCEASIRIQACSVNPVDTKVRAGKYDDYPGMWLP